MVFSFSKFRAFVDTPVRKKFIKYSMVSAISVVTTVVLQVLFYGFFHMTGSLSALAPLTIFAFPSYFLNRSWVWGKSGRSHMRREVIPFWVMVFVCLGVSSASSALVDLFAHSIGRAHV